MINIVQIEFPDLTFLFFTSFACEIDKLIPESMRKYVKCIIAFFINTSQILPKEFSQLKWTVA